MGAGTSAPLQEDGKAVADDEIQRRAQTLADSVMEESQVVTLSNKHRVVLVTAPDTSDTSDESKTADQPFARVLRRLRERCTFKLDVFLQGSIIHRDSVGTQDDEEDFEAEFNSGRYKKTPLQFVLAEAQQRRGCDAVQLKLFDATSAAVAMLAVDTRELAHKTRAARSRATSPVQRRVIALQNTALTRLMMYHKALKVMPVPPHVKRRLDATLTHMEKELDELELPFSARTIEKDTRRAVRDLLSKMDVLSDVVLTARLMAPQRATISIVYATARHVSTLGKLLATM